MPLSNALGKNRFRQIFLKDIQKGDEILGKNVYKAFGSTWMHIYKVLNVEPITNRFNKEDRVLEVEISCSDDNRIIDHKAKRWFSQLF